MDDALTNQFFAACGGRQPRQLVVSSNGSGTSTYIFQRPYLIIGSAPNCHVYLERPEVSYRHAYVQMIAGRVCCLDLASRSGTYKQSVRRRGIWLEPGQEFSIGSSTFRLTAEAESETEADVLASPNLVFPDVSLSFVNSRDFAEKHKSWHVSRDLTLVGWSRRCKVQLLDDTVSRVHASLLLTPLGLWVVDLLGKGGVRVNGEHVAFRLLAHGDELAIGRFRFEVVYSANDESDSLSNALPAVLEEPVPKWQPALVVNPTSLSQTGDNKGIPTPVSFPLSVQSNPLSVVAGGELSERFVISLVNQFALMQQQMMEETQEMIVSMARMYGSMHQNQMQSIQEDLACMHELTREIQELRIEIATSQVQSPSQPAPADEQSDVSGEKSTDEETSSIEATLIAAETLSRQRAEQPPEDAEATPDALDGEADQKPRVQPVKVPAPATATKPSETSKQPQNGVDPHMQLLTRMALLEKERTSRWQRIMRAVTGVKGSDSDRNYPV